MGLKGGTMKPLKAKKKAPKPEDDPDDADYKAKVRPPLALFDSSLRDLMKDYSKRRMRCYLKRHS